MKQYRETTKRHKTHERHREREKTRETHERETKARENREADRCVNDTTLQLASFNDAALGGREGVRERETEGRDGGREQQRETTTRHKA